MYVLGIETSGRCGGVALIDEHRVLGEITFCCDQTYSTRLLPDIKQLLEKIDLTLKDISLIAVSLGPGSFTGLRIGLSSAKAIAFALNIPIIGVPSLDALSFNLVGKECDVIFSLIRARKKELYGAFFKLTNSIPTLISEYKCIKDTELYSLLEKEHMDMIICDEDALCIIKEIKTLYNLATSIPLHLRHLRASSVADLGLIYFKSKNRGDDLNLLEPLYVRAALS